MSLDHPTEETLQQYALEPDTVPAPQQRHIASCAECEAAVAAYRALFTAISDHPAETFDFDVAAAVNVALNNPPVRDRAIFPYIMVALVGVAICAAAVILQTNVANLLRGLSVFFVVAAAAAGILLMGLHIAAMIRNHNRRLEVLMHFPDLQPYSR